MNHNDRTWILMARAISGEASQAEREELMLLLQPDPELDEQYRLLEKLWDKTSGESPGSGEHTEKFRVEGILKKAEQERAGAMDTGRGRKSGFFWNRFFTPATVLAYAAMIVIVFSVVYIYKDHQTPALKTPDHQQVIAVQNGSRTKVLLPDGSTVWLNADSKLYYDPEFDGPVREVRLDGEAFFDIVKYKGKPFIVHAGNLNIRVLGTAFNVKYYKEDENIETTLLRGKIEVTENTKDESKKKAPIVLVPDQKLIVPVETQKVLFGKEEDKYEIVNLDKKLKEDERLETSWIYNRIEFRGESFEVLARRLERWYNVTILFEDDHVKELKFNGSFETETVEEAFGALQKVAVFTYNIKGREIFIKSFE